MNSSSGISKNALLRPGNDLIGPKKVLFYECIFFIVDYMVWPVPKISVRGFYVAMKFNLNLNAMVRTLLYVLIYPNVAKAGGFESQGVKGEAVIDYRDPLTTRDLKSSSFPGR